MSWTQGDTRPLAGLAVGDSGLGVLEPATNELPLRTRPMPVTRPHPRRTYPPAVPCSPTAATTVLPAQVAR